MNETDLDRLARLDRELNALSWARQVVLGHEPHTRTLDTLKRMYDRTLSEWCRLDVALCGDSETAPAPEPIPYVLTETALEASR